MRLTAGGGGAFLSATHKLAPSVEVPRPSQLSRTMTAMGNADKESFELHPPCYPDQRRSRRLALRALGVGWFNPAFLSLPALLYALLFVSNMLSLPSGGQPPFEAPSWGYSDLLLGRPAITSIVLVLVLWAMLAAFFDVPKHLHGLPAWLYRLGVGLVHAAAHVLVLGAIGLAAVSIFKGVHGALFMILAAVFVFAASGARAQQAAPQTLPSSPQAPLVTTGPYRYVTHPTRIGGLHAERSRGPAPAPDLR